MVPPTGHALFVDLYELTMGQACFDEGLHGTAAFSLFARTLPADWGFFLAAGLDDALAWLEQLRFTTDELRWLGSTGLFTTAFLEQLATLRFTGSVRAIPEGTPCFPGEPLLEVTAPILEGLLVETAVLNAVHFQTLVASKAARCVEAARGRRLIDFSARRTHGRDAAMKAARAAYLAGFDATSNVEAARVLGIAPSGTMAHAYVQAHPDEMRAFRAFASSYPDDTILLVDTYDTIEGARHAAHVGRTLAAQGHALRGVRLDSGDLAALSRHVRRILDDAGLQRAMVLASGNLDERTIAELLARGACIDGFGVGTRLGVCADAPWLDMAYKLVEYGGRPTLKRSTGKATWPGRKQVWRRSARGELDDVIALADEPAVNGAAPLLAECMAGGARTRHDTLEQARLRARELRAMLPPPLRLLEHPAPPPTRQSTALVALRDRLTG